MPWEGKRDRFARAGEGAPSREIEMPSVRGPRKYAPGRPGDAKFPNLPSPFANLLENVFCNFGKNPRMPNPFAKMHLFTRSNGYYGVIFFLKVIILVLVHIFP